MFLTSDASEILPISMFVSYGILVWLLSPADERAIRSRIVTTRDEPARDVCSHSGHSILSQVGAIVVAALSRSGDTRGRVDSAIGEMLGRRAIRMISMEW